MTTSFYGKPHERDYGDPLEIIDPRVPPFKVTQGQWNRHGSTYDFLLVIHSDHGPISSEINSDFGRKSKIFPTAHKCPTEVVLLSIVYRSEELVTPLSDVGKSLTICRFV